VYDLRGNFIKIGWRWLARNIGGGGDQRFSHPFDQMPAKRVLYQPDGHRPIGIDQIIGQSDSTLVDNGRGFFKGAEEFKYTRIRLADIGKDIPLIGHQHNEAFGFLPFLKGKYTTDSQRIGSVTTDTPNGIGRV
jgi:hypothetical protein